MGDVTTSPRPGRAIRRPRRAGRAAGLLGLALLAWPGTGPQAGERPPIGVVPAQAPGGATDKFGLPVTPPSPAAPGPGTDKFGLPQPGPTPGVARPDGGATAEAPPADEPEAIGRLRRLLGPEVALRYAGAEVTEPASGAVRLRGVVVERPDARMAIETLTLAGLGEEGVQEAEAEGIRLADPSEPEGAVRIDRLRLAGFALRRPGPGEALAPDAVSLGALRIEGLSVAGETPVAIDSLSLEGYGGGRTTRLALEGFELRQPGGNGAAGPVDRVSLGRLSLQGLDLAATAAALAAAAPPPQPSGSWSLEAEALALGGAGRPLGGLDSLRMTGEVPAAAGPELGRLALRGIRVEPFPGLAEWLERFGYAALVGELEAETRYDRATGRLELSSLGLTAQEIGRLGLAMVIEGATPEALETQELDGLRLVSFTLRYADRSLFDRFVRQEAKRTGRTEQQVRQGLVQQANAALAARGPEAAAVAPIRAAVQRFLRGEAREIEITAKPPEPVPFLDLTGAMAGPGAAQRLLGLEATAR